MSKAQHTPGPWFWDDEDCTFYPENRKLQYVASGDYDRNRGVIDVSDADARLIAAAPELLKALQELSRLGNGGKKEPGDFVKAYVAADKAINKATKV